MIRSLALFISLFLFCHLAKAQYNAPERGIVFTDDEVPRIDVFIDSEYLNLILHPDSLESFTEYPATFIFSSSEAQDTVENVGFRLRGNTSRNSGKKSFKVSFNSFEQGGDYKGLEKINLNGEHNDPSIIRSKACWDLYNQAGIPSARSNHVAFYINSEYRGLYINVEHIDEEFVEKRMSDGSGNLWKCLWPADLNYKGDDPLLYAEPESWGRRAYQLQTNEEEWDYSKLAHFIDVLNNYQGEEFQCELERIFDVDNYLRVIVLDVLTGNWDGPIVNKNNFYLYHNPCTDRISYLPYDLDNTLGIDWFNVDWESSDIYDWTQYANGESRPIYDRILEVEEWRNRYSAYMYEAITTYFSPQEMNAYFDEKLALIESFRVNDFYASIDYGYDYNDFVNSYQMGIGGHASIGLKNYVLERFETAAFQLEQNPYPPYLKDLDIDWSEEEIQFKLYPIEGQTFDQVVFHYNINGNGWNEEAVDIDADGNGQLVFSVPEAGDMTYFFEMENDQEVGAFYPRCEDGYLKLGYDPVPDLVINEFLASNESKQTDEAGEYEDWIEIFNPSDQTVLLQGMFLSDDKDNPAKWAMPNTIISPNNYLIIWADNDKEQGNRHANFKLKRTGEHIGLYDSKENNYAPIDTLTYPEQQSDVSYERSPNGEGDFAFAEWTTFGYNNDELSTNNEIQIGNLNVYPNPTSGKFIIDLEEFHSMDLIDLQGRVVQRFASSEFNIAEQNAGIYFLRVLDKTGNAFLQKLVKE